MASDGSQILHVNYEAESMSHMYCKITGRNKVCNSTVNALMPRHPQGRLLFLSSLLRVEVLMHSSTFLLCSLCFAFVSSTPVNPICPDYFTVFNPSDSSQTLKQRVCQSSSLVGTAQPSVQVAFVLAHGYNRCQLFELFNRDALSTYNYFHDAAVAYNDSQTTSAVFVAPQFLDEEDLTFHTLDSDYLFWVSVARPLLHHCVFLTFVLFSLYVCSPTIMLSALIP